MTSDDLYSSWRRGRRQVDVDDGFADRVMERIDERDLVQRRPSAAPLERRPSRLAWRVQLAAAVFVVGLSIGLVRASFLIVFLLLTASRGY